MRKSPALYLLFLMGLLLPVSPGFCSSIEAKDTLKVNTTWNADTVRVTDTLVIASGVMLTIAPGTRVLLSAAALILAKEIGGIAGGISAQGTAKDSIVFAAADTGAPWGGIQLENGPSENVFEYCRFSHANSSTDGGALKGYQDTKLAIAHCLFERNEGDRGGAVRALGAANRISESVFRSNLSRRGGGAIFLADGTVANSLIENNHATDIGGGGIFVEEGGSPFIVANTIRGNVSEARGGGLYADGADPMLINNLIVYNEAPDGGGLAYGHLKGVGAGSAGNAVNNTIAKNQAQRGGGVYVSDNSSPLFINCILSANEATNAGPNYFELQSHGTFVSTVNGPADIFVDVGHGDFHLKEGSSPVTIDAGNPDTTGLHLPAVDLDGKPRISGKNVDMGAYEFQSSSAIRFSRSARPFTPGVAREGGNLRLLLPADVAAVGLVRLRDARGRVALETRAGDRGVIVLGKSLPAGAYQMDFDFLSRGRRSNFSVTITLP